MRTLLLLPDKYSFSKSIEAALNIAGAQCRYLDYRSVISNPEKRFNTQIFRFPDSLRRKWESYYLRKINRWYIEQFEKEQPELVFVYNNEMLLPETMKWLNQKKIKTAFYLGDNPLYTTTSRYNLAILQYADAVFVPDSYWLMQLRRIGLPNVQMLLPSIPDHSYFPVPGIPSSEFEELKTDVLYVGMNYNDSWGYKKAKFLSFFTGFDLRIYGNKAWKRWFIFFPELENHFIERNNLIPLGRLNKMYNLAKIVPVDGNPGIMNGIHIRVIEALAAGTLPLMEWNRDMDEIFKGITDLPAVKDYRQIPETTKYFLNNESVRLKMVEHMIAAYRSKNNPVNNGDVIYKSLGLE